MKFDLRRPCPHCPFRRDCLPEWLGRKRAEEIAGSLLGGESFACHETTEVGGADPGREQHCAGAALLLERLERPNQLMRIAERLGMYDHTRLDRVADVFASPAEFIEHHTTDRDRDREQPEPCAVAEMGCEAPAGYRVGAEGFAPNFDLEPGLTEPCIHCGEHVCATCSTATAEGARVCLYCDERADEDAA